jgi:hypothetical protein
MIKKILNFGFILFVLLSMSIFAGPFGLEMGMTLEQVKQATKNRIELQPAGFYMLEPPKKNSNFEHYQVSIHANYGVYMIVAASKIIDTSQNGIYVKEEFNRMASILEKTYGNGEIFDVIFNHSNIKDNNWMRSIIEKDREYSAVWGTRNPEALPDNVALIILGIDVESEQNARLRLTYISVNYEKIADEQPETDESVF